MPSCPLSPHVCPSWMDADQTPRRRSGRAVATHSGEVKVWRAILINYLVVCCFKGLCSVIDILESLSILETDIKHITGSNWREERYFSSNVSGKLKTFKCTLLCYMMLVLLTRILEQCPQKEEKLFMWAQSEGLQLLCIIAFSQLKIPRGLLNLPKAVWKCCLNYFELVELIFLYCHVGSNQIWVSQLYILLTFLNSKYQEVHWTYQSSWKIRSR